MGIIETINEKKDSLTKKQRMVALYMLEHVEDMRYETLKQLSENMGVTEKTILSTCQALGYDGINEVKFEFRKSKIASKKTNPITQKEEYYTAIPSYEMYSGKSEEQFLREIGAGEMLMLTAYWNQIQIADFQLAADMICQKRKIMIAGRGLAHMMAKILQMYLNSAGVFAVVINTELNEPVYSAISTMDEDTMLIVISFPDYYPMTVELAEEAKRQNATVLAIADKDEAAVVKYADHSLLVPSESMLFINSPTGMAMLVNLLSANVKLRKSIAIDERIRK